jgi:AraC-like DNA-binding protein
MAPTSELPPWLVRSHAIGRVLELLQILLPIPCSIAPCLPGSSWVVLFRRVPRIRWIEEQADGATRLRQKYDRENARHVRETCSSRLSQLGARHDFTVPIVVKGRTEALLCSGPFLTREPHLELVTDEWRTLFGTTPQPLDREFLDLAKALLELEVLESDALAAYRETLEILGQALSGQGNAEELVRTLERLRDTRLSRTLRVRERRAGALLDESAQGSWSGGRFLPTETTEMGLERVPNLVLAATAQLDTLRADEPVRALLEGRRFQCCAAEVAASLPETVSAPLGDHSVCLMSHVSWRGHEREWRRLARKRAAEIATGVRERFGVTPTLGVSSLGQPDGETPRLGQEARRALELAVRTQKSSLLFDELDSDPHQRRDERERPGRRAPSFESVSQSARRLLDDFSSAKASDLALALDACLETILLRSGGDPRLVRAHLESVLPPLMDDAFRAAGLEPHLAQEFSSELDELLASAVTAADLARTARAAFTRLCSIKAKSSASRELRLATAIRYIEQHCREPLSVTRVAREAGLSRAHFSELFRTAYGVTFSEHLRRVRLNTATSLLRTTSLNATQVAERSGFASVTHFHRAFKQHTGRTPKKYREDAS